MKLSALLRTVVGLVVLVQNAPRRDERGLSQSAEIAILIAGAAVVALFLGRFILGYVQSKLP